MLQRLNQYILLCNTIILPRQVQHYMTIPVDLHNTWITGYVTPADASFCNHVLISPSLPVDSSHNFSSTITEIPVTQKHWQPHICQPVQKGFPDLFIYLTTNQNDMWHNFSITCLWMHTSYHLIYCYWESNQHISPPWPEMKQPRRVSSHPRNRVYCQSMHVRPPESANIALSPTTRPTETASAHE